MNLPKNLTALEKLAALLDDGIKVPGTELRFGIDPLIGMLPGIGDGISAMLSSIILYRSAQLGAPKRHLLLMIANIAIDSLIGAVPVLGDIFDFAFRANRRNIELLKSIPPESWGPERNSNTIALLAVGLLAVVAIAVSIFAIMLVQRTLPLL